MDRKKKINLIFSVFMIILGIMNICVGLFYDHLSHDLQIVVSIFQMLVGGVVICTSILKLKGKF